MVKGVNIFRDNNDIIYSSSINEVLLSDQSRQTAPLLREALNSTRGAQMYLNHETYANLSRLQLNIPPFVVERESCV